jgi:hypothetical protein
MLSRYVISVEVETRYQDEFVCIEVKGKESGSPD